MKEKKCVHVSPRSVSPNLWIDSIEVQDVHLYDELGRIEAAWFFKLDDIGPFIVDIDTEGNNYFDKLDEKISERKCMHSNGVNVPYVEYQIEKSSVISITIAPTIKEEMAVSNLKDYLCSNNLDHIDIIKYRFSADTIPI